MPSPKLVSREYRLYLAIWRKAWLEPHNLVSFQCSTYNMAISIRQGMYRAIRPFRSGLQIDEELRRAADKYVVYLVRPDHKQYGVEADGVKHLPHKIELRERAALAEMEGLTDLLGIDEEDLLIGEERDAAVALKAIMDNAVGPQIVGPPKSKNKFYTREPE